MHSVENSRPQKPLPPIPNTNDGTPSTVVDHKSSRSPPAYYLPGTPKEMFLYPLEDGQKTKEGKKRKNGRRDKAEEGDGRETTDEEGEEEVEGGGAGQSEKDEEEELRAAAAKRRRTRVYRTLVWLQFSFTVFTCIFILVIMVLIAVILVLLSRTIDRADTAIRGNPVSQMYLKLKHAVDRIPGPG